jgi:uncharacterized iron-regulated membrane protein
VSTPSSTTDAPPPRSRDLRDSTLGRIAIIAVVLAVAAVSARSCGSGTNALTQEEAVDAARAVAIVEDEKVLVRYLNQGIPPRGTWIVSFYTGSPRHPVTAQTVTVDAQTGEIVDDGR